MKFNVKDGAKEFGVGAASLALRLTECGHTVKRGNTFTIREIYRALQSEYDDAKTRETTERGNLLALERREKEGELMVWKEVETKIRNAFLPVRQRFIALPSEASTRCNPTDPQHAQEALQKWVDESLALIRENLPKGLPG